jgi:hypothetical protein
LLERIAFFDSLKLAVRDLCTYGPEKSVWLIIFWIWLGPRAEAARFTAAEIWAEPHPRVRQSR